MKKLNSKGFTLIELLAVITILGILMLVAIPAISRTIENSRRDTFMDTAKLYVDAVRTSVSANEIECSNGGTPETFTDISAHTGTAFYIKFDSTGADGTKDLMQSGGKSPWANADTKGYVTITKTVGARGIIRYEYGVAMVDTAGHGIGSAVAVENLRRANVGDSVTLNAPASTSTKCQLAA